jgi:pimeloyl-ACP methyl ester carboxylesterase
MASPAHAERIVTLNTLKVRVAEGGAGAPVLVLHRDTGRHGWTAFHQALTANYRVIAPSLPGYDGSSAIPWARSVHDLAVITGALFDHLALESCAVVGLGFGGWIGALLGLSHGRRMSALVLQSPMGLRPEQGEYADQFLVSGPDYVRLGYSDDSQFAADHGAQPPTEVQKQWDDNRETTCRVAWKPYMFGVTLPQLLPLMSVRTLVVQCGEDRIVPSSVAAQYARLIPNAALVRLAAAPHSADQENAAALFGVVDDFLANRAASSVQGAA